MAAKRKDVSREGVPPAGLLFTIRFFTCGAIVVACYLAWVSLGGMASVGCGPESGCGEILKSRWAYWFGVPVSIPALVIYAVTLAATFRLGGKAPAARQSKVWIVLLACAVLVLAAALWFAGLQIFVLKKICPFCMTAHGCAMVAAVLLLLTAPVRDAPEKPWQREKQVFVPPMLAKKIALAALAGVALLIAGQTLHQRKTYVVKTVAEGVTVKPKEPERRLMQVFGDKFQINLYEAPLLGHSNAPYAIISLFDYTCHSCRTMHFQLKEALNTFSNELAVVSLPMPLDPACNRTVKTTAAAHTNACEYARLGLAVWRAKPEKQPEFDDWIFEPASAPPMTQAVQFAAQLVGSNALQKALQDPWIEQQIQQDVAIYEYNYITLRSGNMPQLIIGTNVSYGTFARMEQFHQILADQLGLRASPKTNATTAAAAP